jgi:hypothetical protein
MAIFVISTLVLGYCDSGHAPSRSSSPPAAGDSGRRPGLATDERQRLKNLEREVRELRRANEILRKASSLFAHLRSSDIRVPKYNPAGRRPPPSPPGGTSADRRRARSASEDALAWFDGSTTLPESQRH